MRCISRSKNFYLMLAIDVLIFSVSLAASFLLRFESGFSGAVWSGFLTILPIVIVTKLVTFFFFGLYRGMWRYTSLMDVVKIFEASVVSSLAVVAAVLFIFRFEGYSRAVFIIDGVLTFLLVSGLRAVIRIAMLNTRGFSLTLVRLLLKKRIQTGDKQAKRLIIIGAGDAGEKMLREILDNPRLNYEPVGFLDDASDKLGRRIHGVDVLGTSDAVLDIAKKGLADEILIAVPSAGAREMRRIIELCEKSGLKYKISPGIGELINGEISVRMAREVSFEDMLGREQVALDMESIAGYIAGKKVLVTGAAGSIGSELCRQLVRFNPGKLVLLDKTENSLFQLEMEFRHRFEKIETRGVLADVQRKNFIDLLFEEEKPEVVFHAAAFKHVHIVELNPWEGVLNNVIGTLNVASAADEFGAQSFVMVSTDKAVRPVGVMGATKRLAEMITTCYGMDKVTGSNGRGKFVSVRFGNVLGSEGSVLHLFKRQIERLGPVTVTHPDITRYFMTIPEAARLILQAGALGHGGEVFVLDMGTPIKILDMARELIKRSGYEPDKDIEIRFIGLRPGEKLFEELVAEGEEVDKTIHDKIVVLRQNGCNFEWLKAGIEELAQAAEERDAEAIKSKLKEIVPEYLGGK